MSTGVAPEAADAAGESGLRAALAGLRNGARSALTPKAMQGAAVELGWTTAHLAMYPFAYLRDGAHRAERLNLEGLAPAQRGLLVNNPAAASTPILLIHGIVDNHMIFALLRRHLLRRGFGSVHAFNYSPLTLDVRRTAVRLGKSIEDLCEETGFERIHVVGHSLGGLIARYYAQRLGGDARIHTLVTLGTPHQGTQAARLLPWPLVKQLRPGSDLMTELDEPADGCRTRFLVFYSDVDALIVPQRRARLNHPDLSARNVRVRGVGHLSLPIDGDVVHQISTALAHLDEHGAVATPGGGPRETKKTS